MRGETATQVETHSGYKADEYPRRFLAADGWLDVVEVEDRWYSPACSYFKVFAGDAGRYILRQDLHDGTWTARSLHGEY
jgi:hypothetical protein